MAVLPALGTGALLAHSTNSKQKEAMAKATVPIAPSHCGREGDYLGGSGRGGGDATAAPG